MTDAVNCAEHPVVPVFHPGPTTSPTGDTHCLAQSSLEYAPGVPLWRRADLATGEQVGHALDGERELAGPDGSTSSLFTELTYEAREPATETNQTED